MRWNIRSQLLLPLIGGILVFATVHTNSAPAWTTG